MKPEETHHPYIRPRDAATLIIVKDNREVLLGLRSHKHVFMPHRYVFPGGRVDSGDSRVSQSNALKTRGGEQTARDHYSSESESTSYGGNQGDI